MSIFWCLHGIALNNYFLPIFYIYITRVTINYNTPHLKSPKVKNRKVASGLSAMKLLGGGGGLQLFCGRPTLALSSALIPQTLVV